MIAYVLSGGSLRGALQVGALQALMTEPTRRPQFIVGTSIGAINGALVAADPTPGGVEHLAHIWRNAKRSDIYPGRRIGLARRLVRGRDSLYSDRPLRAMCRLAMPPHIKTFGDLRIPLYVTTATLNSYSLYIYGDDPSAPLADAIVASASLPVVFPPVVHNGYQYIDGGTIANLALQVAVAKGATEIYALDVGFTSQQLPRVKGMLGILNRTIQVMLHHQALRELEYIISLPGITLHHIQLTGYKDLRFGDFSKTSEMIEHGKRDAEAYLRHPTPNTIRNDEPPPPPPPGAVLFHPKRPSAVHQLHK